MIQVEREIYCVVDTIAFIDGSVEAKHYSVDLSINLSFHLDRSYQFFYIYIYVHIYIYMCVCVCVCVCG